MKLSVKFNAQSLSTRLSALSITSNAGDNNFKRKLLMSCSCKTNGFKQNCNIWGSEKLQVIASTKSHYLVRSLVRSVNRL